MKATRSLGVGLFGWAVPQAVSWAVSTSGSSLGVFRASQEYLNIMEDHRSGG
jgi:hypothetical protein